MIDVKETLNAAGERMEMAAMYLDEQLSRVRAGRANVAILDGVRVNSYGSMVPLNQVANVSVPDARTIAIRPWDKKAIRDIEKAIAEGNKRARLAWDMFEYRLKKYIGAYVAVMDGVDVIVFTGGIGENQTITRDYICQGMTYLGIKYDKELNSRTRGEEVVISTPDSKVRVVVIPTDEELTIASDTMEIVSNK